jgi:hypothetical protein
LALIDASTEKLTLAMTKLSPNQSAKLAALWKSMPPTMRASLHAAAKAAAAVDETAEPLLEVLTGLQDGLIEPAGDSAKAYLFSPCRALTAEPGSVPPSCFRFSPEQISKVWGWLGRRLDKETVAEARNCRKPETDPIWHEFRRRLAASLEKAIASADRVPKDMTALLKRFGPNGRDMLADMIVLLNRSEEIERVMVGIPATIHDLDDELCYRLKKIHEGLVEEAPDAAIWALLLTMGRLASPWQIFRVIEKIGRRNDDLVISKTELAAVGDAVLADAAYFGGKLKHPPANLDEAKKYYDDLDRYVAYSSGMTKEFGIRKDGRWGQSLFGLRAEASTCVEKTFEQVPRALDAGLPEPRRGRSGRIIPAQLSPDAAIERAEGLLYFLAKSREHANAAAVASSQKRIFEEADTRMQDAGAMLVDLVADSEGQNRSVAQEGLEITIRLMVVSGLDEEADLLRRRGVAAAA